MTFGTHGCHVPLDAAFRQTFCLTSELYTNARASNDNGSGRQLGLLYSVINTGATSKNVYHPLYWLFWLALCNALQKGAQQLVHLLFLLQSIKAAERAICCSTICRSLLLKSMLAHAVAEAQNTLRLAPSVESYCSSQCWHTVLQKHRTH